MFENGTEPTFLHLCAIEWHAVGYGYSDALEGKSICPESFLQNIALYSAEEQEKLKSRYHYYRAAGCTVGFLKAHWPVIATTAGGAVTTLIFILKGA